ncbi:hypothetical protein F8M41_020805 [Gigaspora margarita]|uniref:Uncharacterized protein n=1 Tax=Gigaspora margarita TaxID=4874 RepID=A0A8H4EJG0_GIGMA|nr:hypothetical protein F8M41_020805 [Gigaspora margarita]
MTAPMAKSHPEEREAQSNTENIIYPMRIITLEVIMDPSNCKVLAQEFSQVAYLAPCKYIRKKTMTPRTLVTTALTAKSKPEKREAVNIRKKKMTPRRKLT